MPIDEEGNDGFATAFAEFAQAKTPAPAHVEGVEPPASVEPPAAPAPEAIPPAVSPGAEPAPAAAAPDIWANATPEQIAERDRLAADAERHKHSDLSQRGRIAALQRRLEGRAEAQPHTPQEPGAAADAGIPGTEPKPQNAAAEALTEKIKTLKEDYPDVAGPLIELLEIQRDEINSLKGVVGDVATERDAQAVTAQLGELERRHPDFREIAQDANFAAWVKDQPESIKGLASSWDARETSVVLTLFKTERAQAMQAAGGGNEPGQIDNTDATRRARQLEGGKDVRSKSGVPAATGAPNEFEAAFGHFAKRVQQRLGR